MSRLNDVKISNHFRLCEFECKGKLCCGYSVKIDPDLLDTLETLRAAALVEYDPTPAELQIIIKSGYRCEDHNSAVGGVPNSFHTHGMAADLSPRGMPKKRLAAIARDLAERGRIQCRVGYYWKNGHEILHIDVAPITGATPRIFGDAW